MISCTSVNENNTQKWTWLFYHDADGNVANFLEHFKNIASSNDNLDILIMHDSFEGEGMLYYLDNDHNLELLESPGEVNMGAPETLFYAVSKTKEYYPADKYIVSFYNHGLSWAGTCWDETSNLDNLTMDEMRQAFASAGGVDVVMFTAPCLMGSVEASYEIGNQCDVYIGSPEYSGYYYWWYLMDDICDIIKYHPESSAVEFGQNVISIVTDYWSQSGVEEFTLSAIDTKKLDDLIYAMDDVAISYLDDSSEFFDKWISIKDSVQSYGDGNFRDIYDMANWLITVEEDALRIENLENMKQRLKDCVISEYHGTDFPNAHGLTVFFRAQLPYYFSNWAPLENYYDPDYGVDFVQDAHIDELQITYFGSGIE